MRWERRRIDVKRDGDKFVTLYSTEDLPERVIEVGSSLVGLLGSAYQRVDEMLVGLRADPSQPDRRAAGAPAALGQRHHGPSPAAKNGVAGRRRRGRRSRARKA